jgi:hypothetical protein
VVVREQSGFHGEKWIVVPVNVKRVTVCLAALGLVLPVDYSLAAAPDPYQIFTQARSSWVSARYPSFVSYTIAVTVDEKGVQKANHYQALYDSTRNKVFVDAVSEEQQVDPHVPDGVNMSVDPKRQFQTLFKRRVGRPETAVDFLGVPMLAPNYSFGVAPFVPQIAVTASDQAALVREIRKEFNDPMSAEKSQELSQSEGLKQIADVVSTQRDYRIVLDGIETVDGSPCYHLSLQPVHPSDRLRLRELWVDTQNYVTRKLVTQGNFANDQIPWTITFASVDGAEYITQESAGKPVSVGPHTYEAATITFQAIVATPPPEHPWDLVTPTKDVLLEPQ